MSDRVGNPEDWFSGVAAHIVYLRFKSHRVLGLQSQER